METENKNALRRVTDKLFGGLNMSWPVVILYAVGTAVLTTLFMIIPIFSHTSFQKMGETFEAWVFFAIIIMANCKKPLESALKTFVFFLISQPLIYLFQVPFSEMGWGIFGYYQYWFIWTLLTFPMAFVGWFINKKNWLSLLILSPMLIFLTTVYVSSFQFAFAHFPMQLVAAVFCLLQVVLYLYVFTPKLVQRLIGFFVPLAAVIIFTVMTPRLEMNGTNFLPGDPVLSENAVLTVEDNSFVTVSINERADSYTTIAIKASDYGETKMTVKDGEKEYNYKLRLYEDDLGHVQTEITQID